MVQYFQLLNTNLLKIKNLDIDNTTELIIECYTKIKQKIKLWNNLIKQNNKCKSQIIKSIILFEDILYSISKFKTLTIIKTDINIIINKYVDKINEQLFTIQNYEYVKNIAHIDKDLYYISNFIYDHVMIKSNIHNYNNIFELYKNLHIRITKLEYINYFDYLHKYDFLYARSIDTISNIFTTNHNLLMQYDDITIDNIDNKLNEYMHKYHLKTEDLLYNIANILTILFRINISISVINFLEQPSIKIDVEYQNTFYGNIIITLNDNNKTDIQILEWNNKSKHTSAIVHCKLNKQIYFSYYEIAQLSKLLCNAIYFILSSKQSSIGFLEIIGSTPCKNNLDKILGYIVYYFVIQEKIIKYILPNENVTNIHKYMQLKEIVDFKTDLHLALLHFKLCTNNIDDLENVDVQQINLYNKVLIKTNYNYYNNIICRFIAYDIFINELDNLTSLILNNNMVNDKPIINNILKRNYNEQFYYHWLIKCYEDNFILKTQKGNDIEFTSLFEK